MKTLLRRIKKSLVFRLLYRLVCWINYPTSRERMWHMFYCGKVQGRIETLKELPIVKVQPKQEAQITEQLHLRPGEWSRLWREMHPGHRAAIPSQPAYWPAPFEAQMIKSGKNGHENGAGLASEVTSGQLIKDDAWLNSSDKHMTPAQIAITKVDTKHDLMEGEPTEHALAIVKLKHATRKLG